MSGWRTRGTRAGSLSELALPTRVEDAQLRVSTASRRYFRTCIHQPIPKPLSREGYSVSVPCLLRTKRSVERLQCAPADPSVIRASPWYTHGCSASPSNVKRQSATRLYFQTQTDEMEHIPISWCQKVEELETSSRLWRSPNETARGLTRPQRLPSPPHSPSIL